MASHTPAAEHEAGHPSALGYVKVFFVLLALTVMEVGALYVPVLHPVLPFILIGFSALKFSLVAAFYYIRVIKVMYFDAPITATTVAAPLDVRMVLTVNGALVLLLGILPGGLMSLCAQAIMKTLGT